MNNVQASSLCKDYDISADEFRTAAVVELLKSSKVTAQASINTLVDRLVNILSEAEMVSAVKWATWVKYARANNLAGKDAASLLELRKGE